VVDDSLAPLADAVVDEGVGQPAYLSAGTDDAVPQQVVHGILLPHSLPKLYAARPIPLTRTRVRYIPV